jgi:Subtilase family
MAVRLFILGLLVPILHVNVAQAQAVQCDNVVVLCEEQQPKPNLNINLNFELKTKPKISKVPAKLGPQKTNTRKPSTTVTKTMIWQKPRLVRVPQTPTAATAYVLQPSWAGLQDMPLPKLLADDMLDIPDHYIVDLNVQAFAAQGLNLATISIADLAARLGLQPAQIISVQRRFMFSIILKASPAQAEALGKNGLVKTLYADTKIKAAGAKLPLSWGLDRLDAPSLPLDNHFDRDFGNYQTRIYLFDTGVDADHAEFGGRVKFGADFVHAQGDAKAKCREHGTEMASLIAGKNTGAAPQAEIVQLIVLPCDRSQTGAASSLIEAVEWLLIREADFGDGKPVIANMSLAGKWSRKINEAVAVLTQNQVAVVVAAGNNSQDACRFSPASAADAITVAATGPRDETPGFSNFGRCVDINAPGRLLTALTEDRTEHYVASNGTSGAAALVSGLLARSLQSKGPQAAANWLAKAAVPSKLWRKDQSNLKLAQVNPDIQRFCRTPPTGAPQKFWASAVATGKAIGTLKPDLIVKIADMNSHWVQVYVPGGRKGWLARTPHMLLQLDEDAPCMALQ